VNQMQLLIVDDERSTREGLSAALEDHFDVYMARDLESAERMLKLEHFSVILTDLRMAGKEDGFKLIRLAKSLPNPPVCILMTAYGSEDVAVEAMRKGADDYISKGRMQIDELEIRINRALKNRKLEEENLTLHDQLNSRYGLENVIGHSPALLKVLDVVKQVAPTKATVLLRGESGTGKEVIAKAIHQLSQRANAPMVTTHCAALNANLLESELFGHEKGAFTGANERRIGRFEQADGGTLFLDEIGEIDSTIQVKLLRFLGERTFERVGSNKTLSSDVRLITATNKNLEQLVREEKFREDLFFRLRVIEIVMPALRERVSDIPLLAHRFVLEFAKENKKNVSRLNRDTLEVLQKYPWPGNVRELRACMEYGVIFAQGEEVTLKDLPENVRRWTSPVSSSEESVTVVSPILSLPEHNPIQSVDVVPVQVVQTEEHKRNISVKEAEKDLILSTLEECGGNKTAAAEKLGISRRTLYRKVLEYNLKDRK